MSALPDAPRRPSLVSVIIPARNAASTLDQQLAALAAQTYEGPFEVVISDNGSTDDTRRVTESWHPRLPVRIVDSAAEPGISGARNIAVAQAGGDLLLFCDADDEVTPGWMAGMVETAGTTDVVGGRIEWTALNDPVVRLWREPIQEEGLPDRLGWLPYSSGCNTGLWREAFDAIGGYDGTINGAEDVDLAWRAQLRGLGLAFAPDGVVRYRFRTDLRGAARQSYGYGTIEPLLYLRYRSMGVRRNRPGEILLTALWLVSHLRDLPRRSTRGRWLAQAAYRLGRVRGSIRFRVLYL